MFHKTFWLCRSGFHLQNGLLLQECLIFEACSDQWFRALVETLRPQISLKGDYLFQVGEPAPFLLLVFAGRVVLNAEDVRNGGQAFVDAPAAVGDMAALHTQRHQYSAKVCLCFSLSLENREIWADRARDMGGVSCCQVVRVSDSLLVFCNLSMKGERGRESCSSESSLTNAVHLVPL